MKNIWINEISLKKEIKRLLLLMKITFIILFICIFQSQAITSYAQNATISIEKKEVTLEELFNDIEEHSEFLFKVTTYNFTVRKLHYCLEYTKTYAYIYTII